MERDREFKSVTIPSSDGGWWHVDVKYIEELLYLYFYEWDSIKLTWPFPDGNVGWKENERLITFILTRGSYLSLSLSSPSSPSLSLSFSLSRPSLLTYPYTIWFISISAGTNQSSSRRSRLDGESPRELTVATADASRVCPRRSRLDMVQTRRWVRLLKVYFFFFFFFASPLWSFLNSMRWGKGSAG